MNEKECNNIMEVAEGPSICAEKEEITQSQVAFARQESAYGLKVLINKSFDDTIGLMKSALSGEQLSIISEIDVSKLFQDNQSRYTILETCDPAWIKRILEIDRDALVLLPCRVVIYEQNGGSVVEIADPTVIMAASGNPELQSLADMIKDRMNAVMNRISESAVLI